MAGPAAISGAFSLHSLVFCVFLFAAAQPFVLSLLMFSLTQQRKFTTLNSIPQITAAVCFFFLLLLTRQYFQGETHLIF